MSSEFASSGVSGGLLSYGAATGITQTVRNYAASLGFAILGTILVDQLRSRLTTSLTARGVPSAQAGRAASSLSQSQGGSGRVASIPHFVRLDFAYATRSVLQVMAVIMAVAALVAIFGLRPGVQQETGTAAPDAADRPAPHPAEGALPPGALPPGALPPGA